MNNTIPKTPRKNKADNDAINFKIDQIIKDLNREWDLGLQIPYSDDSPSKRHGIGKTAEQDCVFRIKFVSFKGDKEKASDIDTVLKSFQSEAEILYKGWVRKPNGERGVVPQVTRQNPRPVTSRERMELLQCLLAKMTEAYNKIQRELPNRLYLSSTDVNISMGKQHRLSSLDDSPLPFSLAEGPKSESKRYREQAENDEAIYKKARRPELESEPRSRQKSLSLAQTVNMLPPNRGRPVAQRNRSVGSVNTSMNSDVPSVFDTSLGNNMATPFFTQETEHDALSELHTQPQRETRNNNTQCSEFEAGSSFDSVFASFTGGSKDDNDEPFETRVAKAEVGNKLPQSPIESGKSNETKLKLAEERLKASLRDTFRK